MKQSEIKKLEIIRRIGNLQDKANELKGEQKTLLFKIENEEINPMLFAMKMMTIDFEMELLNIEVLDIQAELGTLILAEELNLEFSKD